jgi:hypothetical protein
MPRKPNTKGAIMNLNPSKNLVIRLMRNHLTSFASYWNQQVIRAAEIERAREKERKRFQDRFVRIGDRYYWTH